MQFYLYGAESVKKIFFSSFLEWADLYYVYMHSMMQSEQCYCSTEYNYQLVECRSLRSFFLLQILTLSSNVAHSCRASCGEFTAQWIRVTLSHRKGFGEHPTPPSHTSSPGQIRTVTLPKLALIQLSLLFCCYLGQQQPLSPLPLHLLSLYLRLRFCYTHTLLDLVVHLHRGGQSDYDHIKMPELKYSLWSSLPHHRQKYTPSLC